MNRAGFPDDVPLESKMVTRGIRSAQSQVESRNFEIRKNVLKYDDVLSRQRTVIYDERRRVLEGEDLESQVQNFIDDVLTAYIDGATSDGPSDVWDLDALWTAIRAVYPVSIGVDEVIEQAGGVHALTRDLILEEVLSDAKYAYKGREEQLGDDNVRQLERRVTLSVLDRKWREHLYEMDYLKEGIGLRAMAQRDPLVEYQREGFQLFQAMTDSIKEETVSFLFNLEVQVQEPTEGSVGALEELVDVPESVQRGELDAAEELARHDDETTPEAEALDVSDVAQPDPDAFDFQPMATPPQERSVAAARAPQATLVAKGLDAPDRPTALQYSAPSDDGSTAVREDGSAARRALHGEAGAPEGDGRTFPGTPRNAQCPCGSGKKYKLCHGKNEE
jgi:preprotein translocase subunit SecA